MATARPEDDRALVPRRSREVRSQAIKNLQDAQESRSPGVIFEQTLLIS
jgi:hypothetical protein